MENAPFTFQNALDVTDTRYKNEMPKINITGFGRSDKLFAFSTQKEMERLIDVKIKIKFKKPKKKNQNKTRSCEAIGFSSEINGERAK